MLLKYQFFSKLKEAKGRIEEDLQRLRRNRTKELDVDQKRIQLSSLESRMKNTLREKERLETDAIEKAQIELETLESELEVIPVSYYLHFL